LSNFIAFELFFDDMHSFPVLSRFAFEALGVACDDVSAKISNCGVPVWGFSVRGRIAFVRPLWTGCRENSSLKD
jgi:hypothetical protein